MQQSVLLPTSWAIKQARFRALLTLELAMVGVAADEPALHSEAISAAVALA